MFTTSFFFLFLKKTLPWGAPAPDSVPECPRPWLPPPIIAWMGKIWPWELHSEAALLAHGRLSLVTGVEAHGTRPMPHAVPATLAVPM